MNSLADEHDQAMAAMTDEDRAQYASMREWRDKTPIIQATNRRTGTRSHFHFAEHANIGPGWMMADLFDRFGGCSSFDLVDVAMPDKRAAPPEGVLYRIKWDRDVLGINGVGNGVR